MGDDTELMSLDELVLLHRSDVSDPDTRYRVLAPGDRPVGEVRSEGDSLIGEFGHLFSDAGSPHPTRLVLYDDTGTARMSLEPARTPLHLTYHVHDGDGQMIGTVVQENIVGKLQIGLHVADSPRARVSAEDWHELRFTVADRDGEQIATITPRGTGDDPAAVDAYGMTVTGSVDWELRRFLLAAAIAIDVVVHSESR
ncbi:MAG TPA: hypothetical protein VHF25_10675 [Nitriliruptorales bacterium]|nr:hypothetical protein [Nitriliruptorales bacterium]